MRINRGFTLIELLVTISIIAVLATIGATIFTGVQNEAKNSARKADIVAIAKALESNFDPVSGRYDATKILDGTAFASGQLPTPPEGGSYFADLEGDNDSIPRRGTAFRTCATLSDSTPFCKNSEQATYDEDPPTTPYLFGNPPGGPTATPTPTGEPTNTPTPTTGGPTNTPTPTTPPPTSTPTPTPTPSPSGPESIAGLRLWLKADSITSSDGTLIATWTDSSGNGNNAVQATSSRQPVYKVNIINSKPVLRFDGVDDTINVTTNFPAPYTLLYVAKQTGPARARVLSGLSNNWLLGWHGGFKRRAYFEGWVSTGEPPADSNVYLYTAVGTGSLSTVFENGTQLYSNSGGLAGPNGVAMAHNGTSEYSNADIAEIIVYNNALNTTDRQTVESYLKTRYNIP